MAESITIRRADMSDNPIEALTAVHITCEDVASNTDDGDPITYRFVVDAPAGVDDGVSHAFTPDREDGKHTWDGYVFPADGSYTVRLQDQADDSDVVTEAITVDPAP